MTGARWLRPKSLTEAAMALREGGTVVGGGAALASLAFTSRITSTAIDLSSLGYDDLCAPVIGAMVTLERLLDDDAVGKGWPGLIEAVSQTATPEVRRIATVGGTVGARLPTSDVLPVLCAYGASVVVADAVDGRLTTHRLTNYLMTPSPGVIVEICLGSPGPGAYRRFANRLGFAPALASVAGVRRDNGDELWAGAVAPHPLRLTNGTVPGPESLRSDPACSAAYRRHLLMVLRDEVLARLAEGSSAGEGAHDHDG